MFPGDLLEPNYVPDNTARLVPPTEVERRQAYFDQLKEETLVQIVKSCLHNSPLRRPSTEELVRTLEEARTTIEGAYGELATVDAVRQVRTMKVVKKRNDDQVTELAAKNEEIQQLRQQLMVRNSY